VEKIYTQLPAMTPFWLWLFRKGGKTNDSFAPFAYHVSHREVMLGGPKFHESAVEQ